MNKIVFGNISYDIVPGGYSKHTDTFNCMIMADNIRLDEIETILTEPTNVERFEIQNENSEVVEIVSGYSVITDLRKVFDYVYNTITDEETGEVTEEKCDAIRFALAKPGLKEQTDKNTSDIEYIAIMSDIELEQ